MKPEESSSSETTGPNAYLRSLYLESRKRNSSYSVRAFARDLGMSPAYVSLVLNGKAKVNLKAALRISQNLRLKPDQNREFLGRVILSSPTRGSESDLLARALRLGPKGRPARPLGFQDFEHLRAEQVKVLEHWFHLPILDLTTCADFVPSVHWISRRLRISTIEVREAVDRLQRLSMLKISDGKWEKTQARLFIDSEPYRQSLRAHYKTMAKKAIDSLDDASEEAFARRSISGVTLAVNQERLEEAFRMIERFERKLVDFLCAGACTEVYQLNQQLFPLTVRPAQLVRSTPSSVPEASS